MVSALRRCFRRVKLSGLTKQEYLTRRCQEREITVTGNPRVLKALKSELEILTGELRRIEAGGTADCELLETIRFVSQVLLALNRTQKTNCK